tara:strand:- start:499 stop:1377 length:879 start_codon:yes stop_codon:yes gene_type:complete
MRKVLLASTALVALGSVSAMAADISISGSSEMVIDMGDSATADDSNIVTEHDIAITFSNTSDSGISTSMVFGMDDADNSADDLIVTISGDFGAISYTGASDDHALTSMDVEASGTAEENVGTVAGYTGALPGIGVRHVTYTLPSIVDGLTVRASAGNTAADGEAASYAASFNAGVATIVYGEVRGHTQTDTHVGVSVPLGAATIMLAQNSNDEAGEDNTATLIGATYKVSDVLTVGLESDKGEDGTAANDYSMASFGATYTIAPGLSASITSAETDADEDYNFTSIGLHVSF